MRDDGSPARDDVSDEVSGLQRAKARVKRAVGWATDDRDLEAEGKAEEEQGPAPEGEAVDEAARTIGHQYGEIPDEPS